MSTIAFVSAIVLASSVVAVSPDPAPAPEPVVLTTGTPTSPLWAEVERLRQELWAERQTVTRLRVERNRLQAELEALKVLAVPPTAPIDLWTAGFLAGGGPEHLVDTFVNNILPCESGYPNRTDWVTVVSRTNDVGPAQINMAAHRTRIETIWPDVDAVTSMQNPTRNGHFAGILAADSGTGPWYMSARCHRT